MNVLVRVFWRPGRLGASRPVGRLTFRLAPSSRSYKEGGGVHDARGKINHTNPQSGRCCSARPFANTRRAACPPSSLFPFFLEVTRARLLSDPRSPSQPAGEEGRREMPAPSPGLGPPLGGWVAGGRGGGRARDWEKSRRRHRLWRRRRGKHLSGLERNINKRTPAQDSGSDHGWAAPAPAAARFKGAARAPPPSSPPLPLLPRPAT